MTHQPFVTHVKLSQPNRRCPWDVTATFSDGQVETLASFRYDFSEQAAHEAVASFGMMLGGRTPDDARAKAQEQATGLVNLRAWLTRRVDELTGRMERGVQG